MMNVDRWTAASAVLIPLLAASLYGCYSFIQMPSTISKNNVDLYYTHRAEYSYTALVKPSLLYDDRTKISMGEPLYIKLVKQLNITLQYNLTQTPKTVEMTDATLEYEVSATLSGGGWAKTSLLKSRRAEPISFADTYVLDIEEIEAIVETIGEETGTRVYGYTYEIRPNINLWASAGEKPIVTDFTPTLTIKFEEGKIEFEGLTNTKTGTTTHPETETAAWSLLGVTTTVEDMRAITILSSISLAGLLAITIRSTLLERASRPFLDRLKGDVRDKIIEASEPPERIEKATIKVGSIDDLAKVSEETFKPIIHHENLFYILDGNMRYEFTLEETVEPQEMKREKPVESREEPKIVRVECPYLNDKGESCGVVAFGPTETSAYKRLEDHIAKHHPDKLKEFKDAQTEHRT